LTDVIARIMKMKIHLKNSSRLTLLLLCCGLAQAGVLTTFTDFLLATDPTQTGRLSRNGIQQDWTGGEAFPGVINTASIYHYQTYVLNVGVTSFIQIDVDSLAATTFVSAYLTSYNPDSAGLPNLGFDTNWLGDAGSSGNFFGTDPISFQVLVPQNDNLIIVVNQTSVGTTAASGIGPTNPYTITVEGFIDSQFTDAPEPAAIVLSGGGLLMISLAGVARRRSRSYCIGLTKPEKA
jgi:hypothetical protein